MPVGLVRRIPQRTAAADGLRRRRRNALLHGGDALADEGLRPLLARAPQIGRTQRRKGRQKRRIRRVQEPVERHAQLLRIHQRRAGNVAQHPQRHCQARAVSRPVERADQRDRRGGQVRSGHGRAPVGGKLAGIAPCWHHVVLAQIPDPFVEIGELRQPCGQSVHLGPHLAARPDEPRDLPVAVLIDDAAAEQQHGPHDRDGQRGRAPVEHTPGISAGLGQ